MPYHALPEEILLEILKIYFHTQTSLLDFFTEDHEAWEYTHLSPNDRFPSHLLLVCKQWTRIITPLLYAKVLLRSDDDVALFARTIAENRALGPLVRHLRLDGGYARQLGEVAKHLPSVRGLAIELQMLSKTPVSGLFKAMSLFDPTDVYLHNVTRYRGNQKSVDVARRVYDQLPKWKSLKLLSFVSAVNPWTVEKEVCKALERLSTLPEVAFDIHELEYIVVKPRLVQAIRNAGVRTIRCYGYDGCLDHRRTSWGVPKGEIPEDLKQRVVYEENKYWRLHRIGLEYTRNMAKKDTLAEEQSDNDSNDVQSL